MVVGRLGGLTGADIGIPTGTAMGIFTGIKNRFC